MVPAMKRLLLPILGALALAAPMPALAGDNVIVVELFTSQGCSSCPPADKNLNVLAAREDVLALSMHVDYWDYLGWRDTFGSRENTQRQIAYRDAMGARVVYTPQVIVHGRYDVPGYKPAQIDAAIIKAAGQVPPASIVIDRTDGMLSATISPGRVPEHCTIWIASFDRSATVEIERGENAGRAITYSNVVEKIMRVGAWRGSEDRKISLPQPGEGEGVAIWLQDDRTGHILAASFVKG